MGEVKMPVKVSRVEYICDHCGMDFMKPTGQMGMTNPPWYRHVCPKCGAYEILHHEYPRIIYEKLEGEE